MHVRTVVLDTYIDGELSAQFQVTPVAAGSEELRASKPSIAANETCINGAMPPACMLTRKYSTIYAKLINSASAGYEPLIYVTTKPYCDHSE